MNKLVLSVALILFLSTNAKSQFEMGMVAGLNSSDYAAEGISIIKQNSDEFNLFVQEANYGVHFGLYTRLSLLGIFIEPSFIFNSNSVTYRIEDFDEGGVINTFKNERFNNLDIPVMVGFKLLLLNVYAGPVAHLHINSSSEVFDINGYEQRFKEASYGWQAGVGLDLWKLRFQLKYEGNLTKFGDHITFDDTQYAFDDSASRVLATIGVKF